MTLHVGARRRRARAGSLESGGRVVVLTATARLSRELGERHDAEQILAGRLGWPSSQILPFDAWMVRLWQSWLYSSDRSLRLRLLHPTGEQAVWEDIVRMSPEGRELIEIPRTAEVALAAWNLAFRWELDFAAAQWRDTEDSEAFLRWAREFQRRCQRNRWLSRAELPGFVAGRIREGAIGLPEEVIVVGFDELPPAYRRVLDGLGGSGVGVEVREGWWGGSPDSVSHHAVRAGFSDVTSELRAVASWVRKGLIELSPRGDERRVGAARTRIGVVVPDLANHRERIERIFRNEFSPKSGLEPERDHRRPFNISLGPRLADYPLIESALDVLRMEPESIPLEDAGRLLRSPFIRGSHREFTRRSLLFQALGRLREPRVPMRVILDLASDVSRPWHSPELAECLGAWRTLGGALGRSLAPSDWPPVVSQLLSAMGWPGDRALSSSEYQTTEAWRDVLSELAALDSVVEQCGWSGVVSAIGRIARSRQFQPESDPAPVQILGLLEAGGLEFDRLWIMGMDASSWPRSQGPNPFLPLSLQRFHDMPDSSPERHLEFAKRLRERLLSSVRTGGPADGTRPMAPSVVVSYSQREEDAGIRPSSLFADLPEVSAAELALGEAASFMEQVRQSASLETIEDDTGPAWSPGNQTAVPGGTRVFADQAACPFRAFARARLGAGDSQAAASGLDAMDRGTLIHDVLERVWTELGSHSKLVSLDKEALGELIRAAVVGAIEAMSDHRSFLRTGAFAKIERTRLETLVSRWLDVERERRPFRVVEKETRNLVKLGGVPVVVRADRVDELEDGSRVVIDYKTSPAAVSAWDGSRPAEPQLPIYATHMQAESHVLSAVLFGVVRKGSESFRGATVSDDIVPGVARRSDDPPLDERIAGWRDVLERLGDEFRSGLAAVDPRDGLATCTHCNLGALCRVQETAGGALSVTDRDPVLGNGTANYQ